MSIKVYWASLDKSWLLQKKPDSVIGNLNKINLKTNNPQVHSMNKCPAILNELVNTYNMYSIYDYEFRIENTKVRSDNYDQNFFDDYVLVRSLEDRLFSYAQSFIFFTEKDSLETTYCKFPYMEDNNITKKCIPISGRFDIGKWFRPTEFAFFLKKDYTSFKVEKDEVLYYTQFHTKEKINLVQFAMNDRLLEYSTACVNTKKYNMLTTLENYYKHFKLKKLILKEIKNNLL